MTVWQRLKGAGRSIGLAYARSFIALVAAGYVGALDPTKKLDALWSLAVGAAWSAIPAGLRVAEALLAKEPKPQSLAWRVALSFARAMVTTAVMAAAGPITGARLALHAVVIALVPAAIRAVQEALEATATPAALARSGRTVVDATAEPLPPPAPPDTGESPIDYLPGCP